MDKNVPAPAALILDKIRSIEVGTAARAGYDVIYANKQSKLPKPITSMTLAELQGHQAKGWPAKSTASGGYQFMKATLAGLRKELGLRDTQVFTPDLQDRLGYHLLLRRGYAEFISGKLSVNGFALNLAKEWASFPVLAATQGAKRRVTRGFSYYDGDGLNKSLVSPPEIENLLAEALALSEAKPKSEPAPTDIKPEPEVIEAHEEPISPPPRMPEMNWRLIAFIVALLAVGAIAIFVRF